MTTPYINTKLFTTVVLHPHQMDNKVYLNLKNNLEKKIVGRCFSHFGHIQKIIEVLKYENGIIEAENTEGSALFDISFSCRLCAPLKNKTIICNVDRVNKLLITAVNGPILVIIPENRINDKVFFKDNNNNMRYTKDKSSYILQPGDFVRVVLNSIEFNDGDEKIKAIGFLENIALDEEKDKFYKDLYKESSELVDYDKYAETDKKPVETADKKNVKEVNEQEIKE